MGRGPGKRKRHRKTDVTCQLRGGDTLAARARTPRASLSDGCSPSHTYIYIHIYIRRRAVRLGAAARGWRARRRARNARQEVRNNQLAAEGAPTCAPASLRVPAVAEGREVVGGRRRSPAGGFRAHEARHGALRPVVEGHALQGAAADGRRAQAAAEEQEGARKQGDEEGAHGGRVWGGEKGAPRVAAAGRGAPSWRWRSCFACRTCCCPSHARTRRCVAPFRSRRRACSAISAHL